MYFCLSIAFLYWTCHYLAACNILHSFVVPVLWLLLGWSFGGVLAYLLEVVLPTSCTSLPKGQGIFLAHVLCHSTDSSLGDSLWVVHAYIFIWWLHVKVFVSIHFWALCAWILFVQLSTYSLIMSLFFFFALSLSCPISAVIIYSIHKLFI